MVRGSIVLVVALGSAWAIAQEGDGNAVQLNKDDSPEDIVWKAAHVTPSARQLAWQQAEFACFIHFGINAFTNREWGDGTEDPALFNPTAFDAKQWARVCKDAGMRKLILTTKHHDGFCLWPSKYTDHSVKSSPWRDGQGDVVREVSEACREAGLQFGVYLSPWDRHEPAYGDSPAYNQHFCNQLRELLTEYGPIAEVWFDGACGEGPNGKRQEYDWDAFYAVVRELQPDAVISICGPDVRWVGNEAGDARESEWSVVPEGVGAMEPDLGSRKILAEAAQREATLRWHPAQVDTSIRPGWFYHADQDDKVRSLERLIDIYYGSVGGNAELLLNLPPDQRGLIHENDARRLLEVGRLVAATFDENLALGAPAVANTVRGNDPAHGADKTVDGDPGTYWTTDDGVTSGVIEYDLGEPRTLNRAMLQEFLPVGQRVEAFVLDVWDGAAWRAVASAATIGHKRLLRFDDVTTDKVRLRITESRVCPTLSNFGLFYAPPILTAPQVARDQNGMVTLTGAPGVEIRYWLGHWDPGAPSKRYEGAFPLPSGGVVKALAIPPDGGDYADLGHGLLTHAEFGMAPGKWTVHESTSESESEHAPENALDGKNDTHWQAKRGAGSKELVIDLGETVFFAGFTYTPPADKPAGRAVKYAFYVSEKSKKWQEPVCQGVFDNMENNAERRAVRLDEPVSGRFVRFVVEGSVRDAVYVTVAELGVLASGAGDADDPPLAMPGREAWENLNPDMTAAPARASDALPVSDQENRGGWVLYEPFTDEFDRAELDSAKWWDHNPGWKGRQPAWFDPQNVAVRDGQLHFTMRKDEPAGMPKDGGYHTYTSAAVQSKDTVRYGYFEISARAMASAGSSAFWFYNSTPEWWTEIDVFEIGGRAEGYENKLNMNVHVFHTPAEKRHWSRHGEFLTPEPLADTFHVYGLEWDENELKYYFDGMLVRHVPNTHWHQPLTLNFDSETMPDWFGLPNDEDLPSTFSIEYVRTWKKRGADE